VHEHLDRTRFDSDKGHQVDLFGSEMVGVLLAILRPPPPYLLHEGNGHKGLILPFSQGSGMRYGNHISHRNSASHISSIPHNLNCLRSYKIVRESPLSSEDQLFLLVIEEYTIPLSLQSRQFADGQIHISQVEDWLL